MAANYPLINGVVHSHADIEVDFNGTKVVGVKEITYMDELDIQGVYGTSPIAIGSTTGQHKAESSMTLYLEDAAVLLAAMGDGYGEKFASITVNFTAAGGTTHTHKLFGVRIKKVEDSSSAGPDAITEKFDLFVTLPIERDGKTIVLRRPRR